MPNDPTSYKRTVYDLTFNRTAWVPYAWVCTNDTDRPGAVIRSLKHLPTMRAAAIATTNALHTMTLRNPR